MYKWYLPTLSEVVAPTEVREQASSVAQQRLRVERQWVGAIAALNLLLRNLLLQNSFAPLEQPCPEGTTAQGVVLSGPLPVVETPELVNCLSTYTFTATPMGAIAWMPLHLLPAATQQTFTTISGASTLSLLPNDPLAAEQFCLVLTAQFGLVLVLGEDLLGNPGFFFSFDPDILQQAWQALRARLLFASPAALEGLDRQVEQFAPRVPDFRLVSQFSRLMIEHLPDPAELDERAEGGDRASRLVDLQNGNHPATQPPLNGQVGPPDRTLEELTQNRESLDAELLRAIAHEVRTPLTTIRTLTRLLLKRQDLSPDVMRRLDVIDQECTDQINRFNLFFRAVEVETADVNQTLSALAPISLTQVFQQNLPRWQQQVAQRGLTLEVVLPQKLPMVVTDPTMLDQVLTGLLDRITHTLCPGSHIQVSVTLAGHQLKLQFESQSPADELPGSAFLSPLKSLGQLLMFQPETGNLSLNLSVTKNLFQALGGKLTVKQRPQKGEVLTIFLPLETRKPGEA